MPASNDTIIITCEQLKIEFSTETVAQIALFCKKKIENHKLILATEIKCLSKFCQNNTIFIWSRQDSSATKRNAVKLEHASSTERVVGVWNGCP